MDKLTRFAATISAIAQATKAPGLSEQPGVRFVVRDGAAYSLGADEYEAYARTLDTLLNVEGWSKKFSERYLDDRLHNLLAAAINGASEEATLAGLVDLADEYEVFDTEQLVLFPIEGIGLPCGPVEVGNVRLVKADAALLETLGQASDKVISATAERDEHKPESMARFRGQLTAALADKIIAEYRVVAEPTRAQERAEEEARRALEILRFGIPALYRRDQRVLIGLPGEIARSVRESFSLSTQNVSYARRPAGALIRLELTEDRLTHLREIGVFIASELLQRTVDALSGFDKALLNAIHWFSAAQAQVEIENGFLDLVTCVESLLTPRDGNPIGTALAEGVAMLLGDSLEERRSLKRRFKELYGKRSAVSHGGGKAILDVDYASLEQIAGALLVILLRRRSEFQTQKQLLDWIEDQKLSPRQQ